MKDITAHLGLAALIVSGALAATVSPAHAQGGYGEDTLERMLVPTQKKIQRGAEIYDNQCAGCHGPEGRGEVEYPNPDKYKNPAPNFQKGQFRYGGGPIQIYNAITYGLPGEDTFHPVYPAQQLRYQQRWAVTHYVRNLIPAQTRPQLTDPPEVVQTARRRARRGYCKQPVRDELQSTIGEFLEPKGDEQMKTAKQIYQGQCQTCHGETGKGDGPAGGGLNPPPRNFHATDNQWTNGTSPLAIYNTLLNGIQGTSMAAYPDLSKKERWALVHYVRKWIPESKREETTEEDILKLCRSRSAPPPPEPISLETAREAVVQEAAEEREVQLRLYGDPQFADGADPDHGESLYQQHCASCHGSGLKGSKRGPYGTQPPFFRIRVRPLTWRHAGGTYREFARRSMAGPHASLVDAPNSAMLTDNEWQDLHAFVGTFNAPDRIQVTDATDAESTGANVASGQQTGSTSATDQTDSTNASSSGSTPQSE